MIVGCGRYAIFCFLRCTLIDRVKSCISFAWAVKGLPSGRQAFTLTLIAAGVHGIFRQPLDLERPPGIDCDKAEILRQGGGCCTSYKTVCRQIVGPPPGTRSRSRSRSRSDH